MLSNDDRSAWIGKSALAIMAKRPRAGRTKTRLCPPLTHEQAARLYEAFLMDTILTVSSIEGLQVALAVTPTDEESLAYFSRISQPGVLLIPVEGPTIGKCLDVVLTSLLEKGFTYAAAMSSDSPTVMPDLIRRAFERLVLVDVVICPGDDGGYYWIGVKAQYPDLFSDDIPWSTSEVAACTYSRARDLGLSLDLAGPILDVDDTHELIRLRRELERLPLEAAPSTRLALAQLDLD